MRFGPGSASNAANASKILAGGGGGTLESYNAFDSDQGPHQVQLMNLKVLALGPTLDSSASIDALGPLDSLDAFDACDLMKFIRSRSPP